MTTQTQTIIRAALDADPTLSDTDRRAMEIAMKGRDPFDADMPRRITYGAAAERLGVSRARIKQLVKIGSLVPIRTGTSKRASGVTEASLLALLRGRRRA